MNYLSLFSGIGGFDLGFHRAGMLCVGMVEIDKRAQYILRRHFPDVQLFDDVKNIGANTHVRGSVDIICGGFPCQDVSIAGPRAGLAGARSGLWSEFARIVDELEPRGVVVENVPGLLSSNKGRDFAAVIRWLAERGYGVAWRVLDAQYFGLAQRRRRVFVVASFGNGRAAEILFERDGGGWNTPPERRAGQEAAETVTLRAGKSGGGKGYLGLNDAAMTLGGQEQYLSVMAHGQANAEIVSDGEPSLTANHEAPILFHSHQQDGSIRIQGDTSPTVSAHVSAQWGTGGNNVPMVTGTLQSAYRKVGGALFEMDNGLLPAGNTVRRLTPVECERLQGFPDGWTDGQPDTVRYKQLGNAVAVPVVEWIAKRIMEP